MKLVKIWRIKREINVKSDKLWLNYFIDYWLNCNIMVKKGKGKVLC